MMTLSIVLRLLVCVSVSMMLIHTKYNTCRYKARQIFRKMNTFYQSVYIASNFFFAVSSTYLSSFLVSLIV